MRYDTSQKFNPLAVYLSAIECIYYFTFKEWNERLPQGFTIWVDGYNVEIDVHNSQGPHGLHLSTIQIVLGLYDTILDLSANSRFCEVVTTISLYGRQVGILSIQEKNQWTLKEGEIHSTGPTLVKGPSNTNTLSYPSGHVTDVEDPRFSISYTYSGIRINSKDVFIAVLDALAMAAQFSPAVPFGSLTGKSASGSCVISIVETDSPFQVNFSYVTKALRTVVVEIMVRLRKFGELRFQLQWQGGKMAEGSIKLE